MRARSRESLIAALLCFFVHVSFAQAQNSNQNSAQADTSIPVFHAQSNLVVVRVMVANKRTWRKGVSEKGERCTLASEAKLYMRLRPTEPYIPSECDGLYIRGLNTDDFHVFADGVEQKIQSVASAVDGLQIRDNHGLHNEFSQSPTGRWSTEDWPVPEHFVAEYSFLARDRYDVSFVPRTPDIKRCHKIKVNVDGHNVMVAARDEYCDGESPSDLLNGSVLGGQSEQDISRAQPGNIPLSLQTRVFKAESGVGRARLALSFPLASLHREWTQDWRLEFGIGLLCFVYRHDGTLAYRFSDFIGGAPYVAGAALGMGGTTINSFKSGLQQIGVSSSFVSLVLKGAEKSALPARYESDFDLPDGEYDMRIVLGDGETFGRAEAHLNVERYDSNELGLSSIMLCNRFRDAHVAEVERKAANFAPQYVPMVSKGVEFTPAGDTHFKSDEQLIAYFEVYKPAATKKLAAKIEAHLKIVDAKSHEPVKDFPPVNLDSYEQPGSLTIPVAREVPFNNLAKGEYRLQVQVTDSTGSTTQWRSADFTVEPAPVPEEPSFPASLTTIPEK